MKPAPLQEEREAPAESPHVRAWHRSLKPRWKTKYEQKTTLTPSASPCIACCTHPRAVPPWTHPAKKEGERWAAWTYVCRPDILGRAHKSDEVQAPLQNLLQIHKFVAAAPGASLEFPVRRCCHLLATGCMTALAASSSGPDGWGEKIVFF